ncbi:MAG: flagellar hook-length control protein FliK [Spirochaetaceae bacterium]|nr:flagellar hook-length control protein FliK [Spirochaetaceae bacterium]
MPIEIIAVKKEYGSPECFLHLDKKTENISSNVKAGNVEKSTKSHEDSLTLKDALSFEDILSDKILEKKNLTKEIIFAEKGKTQDEKPDYALNDLLPLHAAIKTESLYVAAQNAEFTDKSKDDEITKENASFANNILAQLFEKTPVERTISNPLSYYLNQNNSIDKNINLEENKDLKKEKEKKEFFKVVDLRAGLDSDSEKGKSLKSLSNKENSEVSQSNRFSLLNNNNISQNVDIKDLPPGLQTQVSTAKVHQVESTIASPKNATPSFHSQFLEYLRESGNADIVKNASIILKAEKEGEIRLLMKPESLGYVRIKLMLSDSNIVGRIIVDNYSVKEIFESNLENLIKNFKINGYSSATIDVAVGGEQNNRKKQSVENERVLALKEIEKIDEHTIVRTMLTENRLVDMVI